MVEFLTPIGWLVALAAVLPVGAGIARARRDVQIRSRIGLAPPGRAAQVVSTAAPVFAVALLAAATARPAVRTSGTRGLRTDAQVFFVLDFPTGKRRIFAAVLPVAFILRRRDP
jgi:hypothetical protein